MPAARANIVACIGLLRPKGGNKWQKYTEDGAKLHDNTSSSDPESIAPSENNSLDWILARDSRSRRHGGHGGAVRGKAAVGDWGSGRATHPRLAVLGGTDECVVPAQATLPAFRKIGRWFRSRGGSSGCGTSRWGRGGCRRGGRSPSSRWEFSGRPENPSRWGSSRRCG